MPSCFSHIEQNQADHTCIKAPRVEYLIGRLEKRRSFPVVVSTTDFADERLEFRILILGLAAVLRQTRRDTAGRAFGAQSLFSTCLATVPGFITEEKEVFSAESNESLPSDIYRELEDFGTSGQPGSGWRHLGEICRHHTIFLLSDAIKEGVIGLIGARELIDLCIRENATEEAQRLLDGVLSHVNAQVNTTRNHGIPGSCPLFLNILEDFVERTGRCTYAYQQFAQLLEEQRYVS